MLIGASLSDVYCLLIIEPIVILLLLYLIRYPPILRLKKSVIKFVRNCLYCQNNIAKIISQVTISNPMSNSDNQYGCTLDSDGELSIKSHMNNRCLISNNACTKLMYYLI